MLLSKDGAKIIAMILPEKAANATINTMYGVINAVSYGSIDGDPFLNLTGLFAWDNRSRLSTMPNCIFDYNLNTVRLFEFRLDEAEKAKVIRPCTKYVPNGIMKTLAASSAVNMSDCYLAAASGALISFSPDAAVFQTDSSGSICKYTKSADTSDIRNGSTVWAFATDSDYPDVADIIIWERP